MIDFKAEKGKIKNEYSESKWLCVQHGWDIHTISILGATTITEPWDVTTSAVKEMLPSEHGTATAHQLTTAVASCKTQAARFTTGWVETSEASLLAEELLQLVATGGAKVPCL